MDKSLKPGESRAKVDGQRSRADLTDSFLRLRESSQNAGAARETFLLAH